MTHYDAIIVGAGAGGGVVAGVLAEAGKRVLLLERGRWLSFSDVGRDHLRNQRLSLYGVNAGPELEGNPRVIVAPHSSPVVVGPLDNYHNNAACVGSGTRVYGGQAWRFLPDDFRMASRYGVPPGSSLADWPITYDDLAPYYQLAENEIGAAGDSGSEPVYRPVRQPYPMPPLPVNTQGRRLQAGAELLGWETQRVPLLINSVPRGGRGACALCQHCVGFACPTDAKNGTQNTMIARAMETGTCTVETGAMASSIETGPTGRVTGVHYYSALGKRNTATSEIVVVSGGAIETARLLLNSTSTAHPSGLGNQNDQVGRNLQGHYYASALGWMPEPIWDGIGPGATTATIKFNHGNDGIIGGGMLADDFVMLPIIFQKRHFESEAPRWGLAHKEWMRNRYRRMLYVAGPVQEIPSPDARVEVGQDVLDRWGIPVPRLSGTTHPATLDVHDFMNARAEEWLRSSGAEEVRSFKGGLGLSGGQHQAGTCRMGHDAKWSVTDLWGRVHGHDNLFVADGSLHVTNGGFNPVLTILALAFRVGGMIVQDW